MNGAVFCWPIARIVGIHRQAEHGENPQPVADRNPLHGSRAARHFKNERHVVQCQRLALHVAEFPGTI